MCGIAGYISRGPIEDEKILDDMVDALSHRGPDDRGTRIYDIDNVLIGLGQSRLSIIDLSSAGHQPMEYKNLSIVFNGEIYNYKEIKKELELLSHKFISNSDTEVILHAFDEWKEKAVLKFIGMFAFSILDKKEKKIYCFRDRTGIKPFFYFYNKEIFLFGSELKSLFKNPAFEKKLDLFSIKQYFDLGYIPSPNSIFKDCFKLSPGSYLSLDLNNFQIDYCQYWRVEDYYSKPKIEIPYSEAKKELHSILKSAFNYRMVADVPVGVFLSGGYDSSAVAAILQKNTNEKLKTFTIGFEEGNNEAPFAKKTAAYLGTDHHEYYFKSKEAQDLITLLPYYYDEPFFDSSAIPTMMVSKLAKNEVSVALSADGGDEIFAGYNFYRIFEKKLKLMNYIPNNFKSSIRYLSSYLNKVTPKSNIEFKHKLSALSYSLNNNRLEQGKRLFSYSHFLPEEYKNNLFIENSTGEFLDELINSQLFVNEVELGMAIHYKKYLPDDILTKVDRATMSVSLEGREPLLDHRIIEYVAQLPFKYKFDGKTSKLILRDIVHDYIPAEMMNRPKTGFSIPIYSWLRGDLFYLVEEYLNEKSLKETGIFKVDFILELVRLFVKGELYYVTIIWKLLMFQMWYQKWMKD